MYIYLSPKEINGDINLNLVNSRRNVPGRKNISADFSVGIPSKASNTTRLLSEVHAMILQ